MTTQLIGLTVRSEEFGKWMEERGYDAETMDAKVGVLLWMCWKDSWSRACTHMESIHHE